MSLDDRNDRNDRKGAPQNSFFRADWTDLKTFTEGAVLIKVMVSNHRMPNHRIMVSFMGNSGPVQSYQPKYEREGNTIRTVMVVRTVEKLFAEAEEFVLACKQADQDAWAERQADHDKRRGSERP